MLKQPKRANLNIWLDGANVLASCSIEGGWQSNFVHLKADRPTMANLLMQIKDILPSNTIDVWSELADPLAAPQNDFVVGELRKCMESTVSGGSSLYHELSACGLKTILNRVNSLPDGSMLTINTDFAFFPWEILYPEEYSMYWSATLKAQRPFDVKKLWGYRFIIDYNMMPWEDEGWVPPVEEHKGGSPFISFNLNPTIEQSFINKQFHPIKFHQDFFQKRITSSSGELLQIGAAIQDKLVAVDNAATIIYLYCHGSSSIPFRENSQELLELDAHIQIPPNALNFAATYLRGPIVFLNSCLSGMQSPLSFSSFHKTFRQKRALGIIGTGIKIPGAFAAAFACRVIDVYLDSVPLGEAMYHLRRELVDKGNPLALFYSLQCPSCFGLKASG